MRSNGRFFILILISGATAGAIAGVTAGYLDWHPLMGFVLSFIAGYVAATGVIDYAKRKRSRG